MSAAPKRRTAARRPQDAMHCTWLAGDLLLVSRLPATTEWEVAARADRKAAPVEAKGITFSKPGESPFGIVLLHLPEHDRRSPPDSIVAKAGEHEIKLSRSAIGSREISLAQFVSTDLEGGDAASRASLGRLLAELATPGLARLGRLALAGRLRELRDALRRPLPQLISGPESAQAGSIDLLMAVDDSSFWIAGWMRDADGTLAKLNMITPEGVHTELPANAFRHPRPDVQEAYGDPPEQRHGFISYLRLARPSLLDSGWIAEFERRDGSASELHVKPVVRGLESTRIRILGDFAQRWPDREHLRLTHALPALSVLQQRHASTVGIEDVVQHGEAPAAADVSVVVPLYGRIDLLEHQLAHFARDPELPQADLIYVLDSPDLGPEIDTLAPELHALYGVPFRVVKLTRNGGFSVANNIGAAQARGRLLLLLNSDVLPIGRGWLGRMARFHDATPEIGALGPKLLFEDLSIQHAGMYFERELQTSLWGNLHYFKGFHRDFAPARVSRPVPAVTGACMMLARDLYQELGGFRHGFVQGGYEDSDLCIRLAERGLRNWYLAEVELYHLEAQSYPSPARQLATHYNTWLQTHLWDQTIDRMMQEQRLAEPAPAGAPEPQGRLTSVG